MLKSSGDFTPRCQSAHSVENGTFRLPVVSTEAESGAVSRRCSNAAGFRLSPE
jgi:hypothetical protein